MFLDQLEQVLRDGFAGDVIEDFVQAALHPHVECLVCRPLRRRRGCWTLRLAPGHDVHMHLCITRTDAVLQVNLDGALIILVSIQRVKPPPRFGSGQLLSP